MVDSDAKETGAEVQLPVGRAGRIWPTMVLGAIILFCGICMGVGGSILYFDRNGEKPGSTSKDDKVPGKITEEIAGKLGLDQATKQEVLSIVEERHNAIRQIRREAWEQIQQEMVKWKDEMKSVLPGEKYELWEKHVNELHRQKPGRFRHRHPPKEHVKSDHRIVLRRMFERHDRNGDGRLTREELPNQVWEKMKRTDRNGDGAITREEMKRKR